MKISYIQESTHFLTVPFQADKIIEQFQALLNKGYRRMSISHDIWYIKMDEYYITHNINSEEVVREGITGGNQISIIKNILKEVYEIDSTRERQKV